MIPELPTSPVDNLKISQQGALCPANLVIFMPAESFLILVPLKIR